MGGIRAAGGDRTRERVITILDDEVALCVVRIELSLAERVLVAQGHEDAVNARRQAVEPAVATAMRAAVERTTGRTVATVVADTHLNPDITMLTFTFAPATAALAGGSASAAGEAGRGR